MGQYWVAVNLDRMEFIHPYSFGDGAKLVEHYNIKDAIHLLITAMPESRGGGDFKEDQLIGRWAGDRVAVVGDYYENGDIEGYYEPGNLYKRCKEGEFRNIGGWVRKVLNEQGYNISKVGG